LWCHPRRGRDGRAHAGRGGPGGGSGRVVPPPLLCLSLAVLVLFPFSLLSLESAFSLAAGRHAHWDVTTVGLPPPLEPAAATASSTTPRMLPGSPPSTPSVEETDRAPTVMRPLVPMTV